MLKYMARVSVIAFGSAIALSSIPHPITLAAPEFCPDTNNPTPAQTARTVEFKQFGVKVRIPANYRTLLRNDGTVSILAPGDFNLIQCLAKGIPVKGTDAIQMDTFQLRSNPTGLSLKDFVTQASGPKFSEQIIRQSINGIEVLVREVPEQEGRLSGSAHAWYQVDGIDGMVEVNTTYKTDLFDLLKRTQLIVAKPPVDLPQPPLSGPSHSKTENLLVLAFKAATDLGYTPHSVRETVLRQNNMAENPTQSTVTITQEGLLDDSIAGHQFMVQFQRSVGGRWEITNLQKKRKCQSGRGSQSYSTELCILNAFAHDLKAIA